MADKKDWGGIEDPDESYIRARFPGHFDSDCDGCGVTMYEGEIVILTRDGEYVCPDCAGD